MTRRLVLAAVLTASLWARGQVEAAVRGGVITQATAKQHGLTRAWFTQIQLDRAMARVEHIVLHEGILYVQTDRAMVHAVDAETGRTLWAQQVGGPNHPSLIASANHDFIAIVNGSVLYVLNRYNGKLLWKTEAEGAPGAGAALSETRAYIPMVDGLVLAYRLEPMLDPLKELGKEAKKGKGKNKLTLEEAADIEADRRESLRIQRDWNPPLACQSFGRAMVQPLVVRQDENEELVAWPTNRGFLFVGRIDRRAEDKFTVRYRLETGAPIASQPAFLPPIPEVAEGKSGVIIAASEDGFVYAMLEKSGNTLWRFSTAEPMIEPPVVIGRKVYVTVQPGGMYCLAADTGAEIWWSPGVAKFIAASKERIYAVDKIGRILVLSAASGTRLDTIPAYSQPKTLINSQTDRLYLASETGLVQCLHEIELTEPIRHLDLTAEDEGKAPVEQKGMDGQAEQKKPEAKKDEMQPADADNPFGAPDKKDNPFGAGDKKDDEKGDKKDNPFGGGDDKKDDANPFG